MTVAWEAELVELLANLSATQDELLELLEKKRELLIHSDATGLSAIAGQEADLIDRLQTCQNHRCQLLDRAAAEGLPAKNIRGLTSSLPEPARDRLRSHLADSESRSRLLHHHSLTNWVLVQRTLIHLSQLLEIIATGGRMEPTYRRDKKPPVQGALMDHAV